MEQKKIYSASPEQTERAGAELAQQLLDNSALPRYIALYGDLGVGKTAFTRGVCQVLCPGAAVRSPTFALVNEYRGTPLSVFHFDMYRIESEDDLISIGYDDYLTRRGICLTEWSEKIEGELPEERFSVLIEKLGAEVPNERRITITHITEENA